MIQTNLKVVLGTVPLLVLFLACMKPDVNSARTEPRRAPAESAVWSGARAKMVSVKEFGAKGDGQANDTAAIQAAINAAPDGTTLRFPAGIYVVSNFRVSNRSGLTFQGEGRKSVIKQKEGAERIATFEASSGIVITKLAFDANGKESYGGLGFYSVSQVRIEDCWFWDSAPKPLGRADRYSVVFGRRDPPSQDIQIIGNRMDDLQLEVDHSRKVLIERNVVARAVKTAGIGIFTIKDGAIAEDYRITNNKVVDPMGAAFSVGLDPPTNRDCVFRRITIAGNEVIHSKVAAFSVRLGTGNSSSATTGNVFEDIVIKDNRIRIEAGAPQPLSMILANTSAKAGIDFDRLTITGNTIENNGPKNRGYAMDLRRLRNSLIANNSIKNVAGGISLDGNVQGNEMRDNTVEASEIAYRIEGSLGGNKVANNRVIGNAKQQWKMPNLKESDSVKP